MNNTIEKFQFQNRPVRIEMIDDEPWFVAKDICGALGLVNPSASYARLDEDEIDVITISDDAGRRQQMRVVNEAGMYNLIFSSVKPEAKEFKRWVTHDVLPAIRREGVYVVPPALSALQEPGNSLAIAKQLVNVATEHEGRIERLECQIEEGVIMKMPEEPANGILFPRQRPGYIRVGAYATQVGLELPREKAAAVGQRLSNYCRKIGIWFEAHAHGNRYPIPLLQEYFKDW